MFSTMVVSPKGECFPQHRNWKRGRSLPAALQGSPLATSCYSRRCWQQAPCCPRQGYPTMVARSKAHRNQQWQQCRLHSGEVDGSGFKFAHGPPGLLPGTGAEPSLCGHTNAHSSCSRKPRDAQTHVSSDCYGLRESPATPTVELVSYSCGALDSLELWLKVKKNRSRKTASPSIQLN